MPPNFWHVSTTTTPLPTISTGRQARYRGVRHAGIDKLQFQPNGDISGMVSAEGELVPLKTRIKPSTVGGAVEKWLLQVWLCHVLLSSIIGQASLQSNIGGQALSQSLVIV